jgi:sRNA-binding protein
MTDPQRTIVALVERFPAAFSTAVPRPLAVGIYHDIRRAEPKIDDDDLRNALAAYTRSNAYLKALAARRATRVNLNGEPVAPVSKADAALAQRTLDLRAAR